MTPKAITTVTEAFMPKVGTIFSRKITQLLLFGIFVLFTGQNQAFAATVPDFTTNFSNVDAAVATNVDVEFSLISVWEPNKTLNLTFDQAFNAAFITENDVDVSIDGQQTSTSTSCDNAAIRVDVKANTLTFSRCPNAAIILEGTKVKLSIGNQTKSYGEGSHQVINPKGPGTYTVTLGGDVDNSAIASLQIVNTGNSSSINAPEDESTNRLQIFITSTNGLPLTQTGQGIEVLPESEVLASVLVNTLEAPTRVGASISGRNYDLSLNSEGLYSSVVQIARSEEGIQFTAEFANGQTVTDRMDLNEVKTGHIYVESIKGAGKALVPESEVTINKVASDGTESLWSSQDYGYDNPFISLDGSFGLYVPNGTYKVLAKHPDYGEASARIEVNNNILSGDLNFGETAVSPITRAEDFSRQVKRTLNSPQAAAFANAGAPAAAAAAGGSLTSLLLTSTSLPYLQYLFTSPFLLFRRKRKTFGVVYNSITKLPIGLAIVRVFAVPGNKLIRTVVTSPKGEYVLAVTPGRYRLEVIKPGFVFPSLYLETQKSDGKYQEINVGQTIILDNKESLIAANVPMDPTDAEATRTPFRVTLRKLFNVVPRVSALVGLCLSVAVLAINPTLFTGTMFGVQLVILAVVLRLVKRKHPFGWGVVKDSKTHKPIGNAVVRLFEPKYNKLVESTLSDKRGRYSFLLGPNQYYVTINKTGYIETQIKPIDYSDKKEPTLFAMDVDLEPQATVNSE